MIAGKLALKKKQVLPYEAGMGEKLGKAWTFIQEAIRVPPEDGRYALDGEDLYALVQTYRTKPASEKSWESHDRYIDLQYMLKGQEALLWAPVDDLGESSGYHADGDYTLYTRGSGTRLIMREGYFVILFPEDGHKPGCMDRRSRNVRKIVVKIRVDKSE